ncbi:hypothetical protein Apmu_0342_01 [Acidiphilium multivorum AIU301]|nr:hypothetical protein Apmu_0342_01 [Acidiphilium multivorum AIU301]
MLPVVPYTCFDRNFPGRITPRPIYLEEPDGTPIEWLIKCLDRVTLIQANTPHE